MATPNLPNSTLLRDAEIAGSITFKGEFFFDGKFKGDLISGSVLVVGESAVVEGHIAADYLTILGSVKGDVSVREKCHLKPTAHLEGDLKTSRLVMEDGATFIGSSQIAPKATNVVPIGELRKA